MVFAETRPLPPPTTRTTSGIREIPKHQKEVACGRNVPTRPTSGHSHPDAHSREYQQTAEDLALRGRGGNDLEERQEGTRRRGGLDRHE